MAGNGASRCVRAAAAFRSGSMAPSARDELFEKLLNECPIDMAQVKALAFQGVPEHLRSSYWKLLLGFLPPDRTAWTDAVAAKRSEYEELKAEFLVDPRLAGGAADDFEADLRDVTDEELDALAGDATASDPLHPLAPPTENAKRAILERSRTLLTDIHKDVRRTYASFHFFRPHQYASLRNILVVFGLRHADVGYVQGLNELVAPIYFVFANCADESERENAEVATYFCFENLLEHCKDAFQVAADSATTGAGINGAMRLFALLIDRMDPHLSLRLKTIEIEPAFYAFRWLSLLLAKEFLLPDLMRLWDSTFALPGAERAEWTRYVGLALLLASRQQLMDAAFPEAMSLLQSPHVADIDKLIKHAAELRESDTAARMDDEKTFRLGQLNLV